MLDLCHFVLIVERQDKNGIITHKNKTGHQNDKILQPNVKIRSRNKEIILFVQINIHDKKPFTVLHVVTNG